MDSTILRTPKIPQHVLQVFSKKRFKISNFHQLPHLPHPSLSKPSAPRHHHPLQLPKAATPVFGRAARGMRGTHAAHAGVLCNPDVFWFAGPNGSKKTHISYQRSSVIHHLKGKHLATPVLGYPFHRNCLQLECNY